MKRISLFLALIAVLVSMSACSNALSTPKSSDEYYGTNYKSVENDMQKAGFMDITTTAIDDLLSTDSIRDGEVEQVSINGIASFAAKSEFPRDASVTITFHTIKKAYTPISSNDIQGTDFEQLGDMFINAGFINVELSEVFDLDPDTTESDYINNVSINGNSVFENLAEFPYDGEVSIVCHRPYEKYIVKILVDFVPNLLFSKYDVDFQVNGVSEHTLGHGDDADYIFKWTPGKYTITFANKENSSVDGETTLDVSSNMEVSYKIYCFSDRVNIETLYVDREKNLSDGEIKMSVSAADFKYKKYNDIITALEVAGFTNIETEAIYDLTVGFLYSDGEMDKVSINGKSDFTKGDVFPCDAKIVIAYHTFSTNDPAKPSANEANETQPFLTEQPEAVFPQEMALRAAVVAFTNRYADDVFTNDVEDVEKFHSYADVSGFLMYPEREGTWSAKNETTWHVEKLRLKVDGYDAIIYVSLDVSFDGENYIVSNLSGTAPSFDDVSIMENESDFSRFFIVPPKLIEEGRAAVKGLREFEAQRAFKAYGEYLYPYGFEPHWYRVIESWQVYNGSWYFKVEVTITNQYGAEREAIAEAYINNVTEAVEDFLVY